MTVQADIPDTDPDNIGGPHLRNATRRAVRRIGIHGITGRAMQAAVFLGLAVCALAVATVAFAHLGLAPNSAVRDVILPDSLIQSAVQLLGTDLLTIAAIVAAILALGLAGTSTRAIVRTLNLAYGQAEMRGAVAYFAAVTGLTLLLLTLLGLQLAVITVPPVLLPLMTDLPFWETVVATAPWPLFFLIAVITLVLSYRIGPCPRAARVRVISPGHIIAAALSALGAAAFALLVQSLGDVHGTVAVLIAVPAVVAWVWLNIFALYFGALFDAELEQEILHKVIPEAS